ncbi:hypothetical protein ScPMuIL_004622 [Solemya velum]
MVHICIYQCIFTTVISYIAAFKDVTYQPSSHFNHVHVGTYSASAADKEVIKAIPVNKTDEDIPLILWWTRRLGPEVTRRIDCGPFRCYSSSKRKFLKRKKTRGLMFYGSDLKFDDLPLPRRTHHEWALYHEESPMNNYAFSHLTFIKLFNHTATFRRESHYPLTTQNFYSLKYITEKKPVPLLMKNSEKKRRNIASVLYIQSHEEVPSDRDRYVAELMKYIKVDSYGASLHNRDLPEKFRNPAKSFENEEFMDFISIYKFHLSFENAICEDYITEKLTRPLHVGSIPIYRGSPSVKDWAPNNQSVILVDDFESPYYLAQYISFLDNNDEEYEKYLSYKSPGGVTNTFLLDRLNFRPWGSRNYNTEKYNEHWKVESLTGFECHVCKKLNEQIQRENSVGTSSEFSSSVPSPNLVNNSHMGCPQPYPSVGDIDDIQNNDPHGWRDGDWVSIYWDSMDSALAVRQMLESGETDSAKFDKYLRQVLSNRS